MIMKVKLVKNEKTSLKWSIYFFFLYTWLYLNLFHCIFCAVFSSNTQTMLNSGYTSYNAKQKRKFKKSPIFSSVSSSWSTLSPVPRKAIIFDLLMQGHEMSYFLKLIAFMYSSYLYRVSLFFLVTQESPSNPLSQNWLFCMYEHQTFLHTA